MKAKAPPRYPVWSAKMIALVALLVTLLTGVLVVAVGKQPFLVELEMTLEAVVLGVNH